jgi:DNA-binding CsgD family transcriptional regulator
MMASIEDYDELLTAVYEAGQGRSTLGGMLCRIAHFLNAAQAGFLVFDEADRAVTHGIVAPPGSDQESWRMRLGDMNAEPGIRALSARRLPIPRRFTDLVPRSRLRNASWFRRQELIADVGYGIAVDLDLGGSRVRLFGVRAAGAADFETEPLRLLGLLVVHVHRAFAAAPYRLAPHNLGADVTAIVYRTDMLGGAMRGGEPLERRLIARFGLTHAEARVAAAALEGDARATMAARLGLSLNSVKTHLRRIYEKLGIARAAELMKILQAIEADAGTAMNKADMDIN